MRIQIFLTVLITPLLAATQSETAATSEIEVPIIINLKPFYSIAEKSVNTLFTSPNYPEGWVQADCATRYKYRFRRSPFTIEGLGSALRMSFTGYYQVTGSTRACLNGTPMSPWTPPCRCGFEEGERIVKVGLQTSFGINSKFLLKTTTSRMSPQALNNCEVCFWGQNITPAVLDGLKEELYIAVNETNKTYGLINLRPYFNILWQKLNEVQELPGIGYFALRPKSLRMNPPKAVNDYLDIRIGISAAPLVQAEKPQLTAAPLPDISGPVKNNSFDISLDASLQYDSLSHVLQASLQGKKFQITDGLIKQHVEVKRATISGADKGQLHIVVDFDGSYKGQVRFSGKPAYNDQESSIEIRDLEYELNTKNLLLKTARWLFSGRIQKEIETFSKFPMQEHYKKIATALNEQLNRQWMKGVKSSGSINQVAVQHLEAKPDFLYLKIASKGKLNFLISSIDLDFGH